jgi:ABC-type sugar transport system permease subunit
MLTARQHSSYPAVTRNSLFIAGRQRYRSVYAALYVLPLLLSTAGIALMWEALLDPNFGGLTALSKSLNLGFL